MKALIPLFVILPLAAAFLIPVFSYQVKNLGKYLAPLVMLLTAFLSMLFLFAPQPYPMVYMVGGWEPVEGIPIGIHFSVDGLTVFMLAIINVIGFLSAFYSISYIEKYTGEKYFYALFCTMVAGMNGVVLSGDLFNIYVFLEISVIASYALVAFGVEKQELEASFKYQVLGGMASMLILLGITLIYWQTKTLNFADASFILSEETDSKFLYFTQFLLLAGFGLKAAMIPFHAWLPDAHSSAPSPISAMLSGVLIKAIGIYAILRLFFNLFTLDENISWILIMLGMLSMILGAFLSIGQWDLKRLLAYSSISQMGYVILGVAIGMLILARGGDVAVASLAIAGGLFHLMNHAVFKGLLFLNAGALEYSAGTRHLMEMGGLHEKMPVTSATSLGATMAISGVPPFNGFFSKLLIIIAAVLGKFYLLALIAVVVSFLTLSIFLKVRKYAFYGKPFRGAWKGIREAPFTMSFSMIVLSLLCLALSLLIVPEIREIVLMPAVDSLLK